MTIYVFYTSEKIVLFNSYLDASLKRVSDPVEATKRESKDTQPVEKVRTCSV